MVSSHERILSLDAFRGLTMALMVIVNAAGSNAIYRQLRHADWNGWTVADTVFPSFLWIVGVAIPLVLSRRLQAGVSRRTLLLLAVRRSLVLYLLGILIYVAPSFNLGTQRLLGVLQRIALCYLAAVAIYLGTSLRGQLYWTISLLTVYWLLLKLAPVPHFGAGDLSIAGNVEHYVDRIILGSHNYRFTKTWDPEGLLSTLPAVATTLLGVLAGEMLQTKRHIAEKSAWLLIAGNLLVLAGLIAGIWMPVNKHLWTSSFVLLMAGIDGIVFGSLLWLVDGCGYRKMVQPFVVLGVNAITIYMASELVGEFLDYVHLQSGTITYSLHQWIYIHVFRSYASDESAALLYALAFLVAMYALAFVLYRRKWFLRI